MRDDDVESARGDEHTATRMKKLLRNGPNHPVMLWLGAVFGVVIPAIGVIALAIAWAWPSSTTATEERIEMVVVGALNDMPARQMSTTVQAAPGSTVHVRIRYAAVTSDFVDDLVLRLVDDGPGSIVSESIVLTTAVGDSPLDDTVLGSGGINLGDYTTAKGVDSDAISGQVQLLYRIPDDAACTSRLTAIVRSADVEETAATMLVPLDLDGDAEIDTGDC